MERPIKYLPLLLLGLLLGPGCSSSKLQGQVYHSGTDDLTGKDRFQAAQWLRLAAESREVGDYPMVGHFCRLIVEHYPNTYYSKEAEEILKDSSDPDKNRSREKKKDNPALYLK